MSETKKLNVGDKFAHATVGNVADFSGKAFLKEVLGLTGAEVSLGTLDPGQAVPFFPCTQINLECALSRKEDVNFLVAFVCMEKTVQLDGDTFPIASGSVVRVSTGASRNHKNNSNEPMVYICIQAKEGSLDCCTADDAIVTETESKL